MRISKTRRSLFTIGRKAILITFILFFAIIGSSQNAVSAPAAAITVNTTADEFGSGSDCSLREAIQSANTNTAYGGCTTGSSGSADTINLSGFVYEISIAGTDEDINATGDFDITSEIIIVGAGSTVISGGKLDRIFHIHSTGVVTITDSSLASGAAPDGTDGTVVVTPGTNGNNGSAGANGGAIYNAGFLYTNNVVIQDSKAGDGGDGSSGANGSTGVSGGGPGNSGGDGGDGANGGHGGGIYNTGTIHLINTSIVDSAAGNGGSGGIGGKGGNGGEGTDVSPVGGTGGTGGDGGNGSDGGDGGAIYNAAGSYSTITTSTIADNGSGVGGNAGIGGRGGNGGDGFNQKDPPDLNDPFGNGGNGNVGGIGGTGGDGGEGGGVYHASANTLSIANSEIRNNDAHAGGDGGTGGNGGDGGNGGNHYREDVECVAGNGGNGWKGGNGGNGGDGGNGGGIASVGYSQIVSSTIRINDSRHGGAGGDGGIRGDKGDAGIGYGKCKDGDSGSNGIGNIGGDGGDGGDGGGIFQSGIAQIPSGNMRVIASTISGNSALGGGNGGATPFGGTGGDGGNAGDGGGLYDQFRQVNVDNSTVSANTANSSGGTGGAGGTAGSNGFGGDGGGIMLYQGTLKLYNITIALNDASSQGGGYRNNSGSATLGHVIIANNTASVSSPDCHGSFISADYNLIEDNDCITTGTTTNNVYNQDPNLESLADNGGPTKTHALLPGSPAIDAGNAVCDDSQGSPFTSDQRGSGRPLNGYCDIGAFELPALVFIPLVLK